MDESPFPLCWAVLAAMVERACGRIVNIGSVVATAPLPGNAIGVARTRMEGLRGLGQEPIEAAEVAVVST